MSALGPDLRDHSIRSDHVDTTKPEQAKAVAPSADLQIAAGEAFLASLEPVLGRILRQQIPCATESREVNRISRNI